MSQVLSAVKGCVLCETAGGQTIWQGARCRVIRVDGAEAEAFPAVYRVVWNAHVAEWTDLDEADRQHAMQVLVEVERAVRRHLQPHKVNLAALGNVVPHLHWHVVARFEWDSHFPAPIWAEARRAVAVEQWQTLEPAMQACDRALQTVLRACT